MWFRGRTVAAVAAAAALTACAITYVALRPPGTLGPDRHAATVSSPESDGGKWSDEAVGKLNKALDLIEGSYLLPIDRERLLDGAVRGMVETLGDPYSVYISKEEAGKYTDSIHGTFSGIGAELAVEKGSIVIIAPIKGTPAERAGLQPRDVLLSVNGVVLHGMSLNEAVSHIRGPKGTKAKLKVMRDGAKEPLELELVRDTIDVATVSSSLDDDRIGLLTITQFTSDTAAHTEEQLADLEAQGMRALVIDLRSNPGGMLQAVLNVADLLVPVGKPIVQYENKKGKRTTEVAGGELDSAKPYPIVVLVNRGSASSAEILAGALKQSAGATLVGEPTYGKGTVQVPFGERLGDGSLVKLTISKWMLPDGTWVNETGIAPDIAVEQPGYRLAVKLPRDRALKYDDVGGEVANLQSVLEGVGTPADRKDGYFSAGTREAVRAFQRREGLLETGEADEATADRLEEALNEVLRQPEQDFQLQAALDKARETL